MAKQTGPIKIKGTIQDTTFYKLQGEYYARTKSSLDSKRVKNDPAFAKTMQYANLLGRASKLASQVYRSIPVSQREFRFYRELTGKAIRLLKAGKCDTEVIKHLMACDDN